MTIPVQIPGAFYAGLAPRGPIALPGAYTVKLTVDGQSQTVPLQLLRDPRVKGPEDGLRQKFALSVEDWHDIDALHRAVNDIRAVEGGGRDAAQEARRPIGAEEAARRGRCARCVGRARSKAS